MNGLSQDLFSLPAENFVDACAEALDLTDLDLTTEDRLTLASAIRGGTNRLRVIDALKARRPFSESHRERSNLGAIRREPDQFVLLESFTRFAPEDDAAFLRYSFSRICGRDPSSAERLALEFDLRRRVISRAKAVKKIVALARRDGQEAFWDTLLLQDEDENDKSKGGIDPHSAQIMPAGLFADTDGQVAAVFVREIDNVGWMVGPGVLAQPLQVHEKGWKVNAGWLLTGPKRGFAEGTWFLDLDIVQPDGTKLDVEIVANSGLDFLQTMTIVGSFCGTLCVDIRREDLFIELRVRVHERDADNDWLRPRNISMRRAAR
jgi:hypothetical protein